MPTNGPLASSAVEGGSETAGAAHSLTVPATSSSGGGGLESVSIAGCGYYWDVIDKSVQVQDAFAAACKEFVWLAMVSQRGAASQQWPTLQR